MTDDKYIPDDDDMDFDDTPDCENCPNNTPAMCPYENDGKGKCPKR